MKLPSLFCLQYLLLAFAQVGAIVDYEEEFSWNWINYTWPSWDEYTSAVENGSYIPANVEITSVQHFEGKLYFAMPRIRPGVPWTLGFIELATSPNKWPRLTPYPDLELSRTLDQVPDCETHLDNVRTIQINSEGIMWVLDSYKKSPLTNCPQKIVILDIKKGGDIILSYQLPESVCPDQDCVFDGIRVEEDEDDTFAYISDCGPDTGIIVFSLKEQNSWKFRDDDTMAGNLSLKNFLVNGHENTILSPIGGIALEPPRLSADRKLFYTPVASEKIYSIPTRILKMEPSANPDWKESIKFEVESTAQTAEINFDNAGNLYSTLAPLYAIIKWSPPVEDNPLEILVQDDDIQLGESFSLDDTGNLRLLSDNIHKYVDLDVELDLWNNKKTIFKIVTGTLSYFHGPDEKL